MQTWNGVNHGFWCLEGSGGKEDFPVSGLGGPVCALQGQDIPAETAPDARSVHVGQRDW